MRYIFAVALIGLLVAPQGRAQTASAGEQELVKLEDQWMQAVVKRDVAALNRLYADEYVGTDQEGAVWNKAQDIGIDTIGVSRVTAYKLDDLKVRLYGDVALVTGRNTGKGTHAGKAAIGQTRFTDMFVKRDGRWQCVASQVTAIAKR